MAFGAMVALARRAREGGSWLVRISLAQTGRWLVGRGEVPEAELKDVPKEFTRRRAGALVDRERDAGRPAAAICGRPCSSPRRRRVWARPSVPLGYNEPVWPARA